MKSIWDRLLAGQLDRASSIAGQAHAKASDADRRITQLESEIDSLTLIVMAMWELFGKSNGLFLKDLEAKIQEIDLRDGKLDGKLSFGPITCSNCNRKLDDRRKLCIYCGASVSDFRKLSR